MSAVKSIIFFTTCLVVVAGCASSGDDGPTTEVDGPIVSEAQFDEDRQFSDEEVISFAGAYIEVTAVQQKYQHRMQDAEDEQQLQQLSDESAIKAEEAMGEHGLTPAEYNAIVVRMPDDDELRGRVQQAIHDIEEERIEETERQLETP